MSTYPEIIGLGEVLIDFIASEPVHYTEASTFIKCFGGAPMNTIVGVARLGVNAGAFAVVGEDPFGEYIIREFKRNNVDTSHVIMKKGKRTTLAFVINEPATGERAFFFYRKPWSETADSALTLKDVDRKYISKSKILHVSGFALSQNPSREAVLLAIKLAKNQGVKISFDPTLRSDVWNSKSTIRKMYISVLRIADIATFSREEAEFIFQTSEPKEAAKKALEYGVEIVGVKLGAKGALIRSKDGIEVYEPAYKVNAIDTTGAGDGWNAGLLVGFIKGFGLGDCLKIANAVGALVVTKRGAITALPYREELNSFLKDQNVNLRI
jgi:sugar/nucleoside kinase (ribokinase family)